MEYKGHIYGDYQITYIPLPEIHIKIFGYSFCGLPVELGGKRTGLEDRLNVNI